MIGEINPKLQTQVKGEAVTAKSSLLLRSASHPGQGHSLTFPALPCPALVFADCGAHLPSVLVFRLLHFFSSVSFSHRLLDGPKFRRWLGLDLPLLLNGSFLKRSLNYFLLCTSHP